jgi:hypothetical protein
MIFGKQHYFCPNCGTKLYDAGITVNVVRAIICSNECREEWEKKYARAILGKSAEVEDLKK